MCLRPELLLTHAPVRVLTEYWTFLHAHIIHLSRLLAEPGIAASRGVKTLLSSGPQTVKDCL